MVEIRTDRLLLRPAKVDDVAGLWDVFRRSEAMKYWSELPHALPDRTVELVNGMIGQGAQTSYFTVEHEGQAVGTAGFWQGSEVGYILHPRLWGQGLGKEMLRALIRHGFEVCKFDAITADVDPRNAVSIRLLEKQGFKEIGRKERTLQLGDVWVDSVYFALDAPSH